MNYKASPHLIEIFDFDILHMELNTALYILVLVLVVMYFLNRLLFRPVLRTLDNRAALRESLDKAAGAHRDEVASLGKDYEARLADVRAEVAQVRQESSRQTQSDVDGILSQARKAAQQDFEAAMGDLHQQVEAAKRELGDASRRLAEQTTNRILRA
jgi:F-type H+-transporting ATPase subunit b